MSETEARLKILLIEDDRENLNLLLKTLPKNISEHNIIWEPCESFEDAEAMINSGNFDLIVTDVYRDRRDRAKTELGSEDARGPMLVSKAKEMARFCPVIAFSDGSKPENLIEGPFIKFADKSAGNEDIKQKMIEVIETVGITKKLEGELDRANSSYLWTFVEDNWEQLKKEEPFLVILERLIRRRAAIQLGRLDPNAADLSELENIAGVEFYICPIISGSDMRLGEIIRKKDTEDFRVVLTPHCHLMTQESEESPRADFVLTVKALKAEGVIINANIKKKDEEIVLTNPFNANKEDKKIGQLKDYIKSPAGFGRPNGRYWFLPRFLSIIPDLFCDFLQIESIPYSIIQSDYDRVAVLDTPFAEAIQSCFTSFYSAVGLPELNPQLFSYFYQIFDAGGSAAQAQAAAQAAAEANAEA